MPVLAAYAVPHPPILIPEIGHGEERKITRTTQAYEQVACLAAAHHPDVLIVISPHATTYADYFDDRPLVLIKIEFHVENFFCVKYFLFRVLINFLLQSSNFIFKVITYFAWYVFHFFKVK